MSLILEPNEIKNALEGHYWQPEGDHYEAIAKAQANKMAKKILEWVREHDCRNDEDCESALYEFLKSEGVL
jgi:hypothetical protein